MSLTKNRKTVATALDGESEDVIKKSAKMMDHSLATHRPKYTYSGMTEMAVSNFNIMK